MKMCAVGEGAEGNVRRRRRRGMKMYVLGEGAE
jgi:hypothetical protein